jgi:hypothetical protein
MNEDKYLDELFSSAKKQDNLLNDNEIQSLLEASNKTILKTNFGDNKMKMFFLGFTAIAIVSYFGFNFLNNKDIEPENNIINSVVGELFTAEEESKIEEILESDIYNTEKDTNISDNSTEELTKQNEKPTEPELTYNDELAQNKQVFVDKSNIVKFKPSRLIKLNEQQLKELGIIKDGNSLKFSFDEKEEKASVVTLFINSTFKIEGGYPLNSITPQFVSEKNGIKIMSFFDDKKSTVAYRTRKLNDDGEKQITTILKRNYEEDIVDIKMNLENDKYEMKINDSVIIYRPDLIEGMFVNKDEKINNKVIIDKVINVDINQFPKINSQDENSTTFTFDNGTIFINDAKTDIDNSNIVNFQLQENIDVTADKKENKELVIDENGQLSWIEKTPKTNFVMVKKYDKDGKTIETRTENIMSKNTNNINIDSLLKTNNIFLENINDILKNSTNNRKINIDDESIVKAEEKIRKAYQKSKIIQQNVENYFNHNINELIPIEVKLDGEELDYVLWFKPTMEFLSKLPADIQERIAPEIMKINADGVIFFPSLPNGTASFINSTGQLASSSDKNLKIDDGFIENAIDKVLRLKPRYFYWKDTKLYGGDRNLGFYAQEVNEVSNETSPTPLEGAGWGIYDRGLIAILTKAIQEQQEIIENLKKDIDDLKSKI